MRSPMKIDVNSLNLTNKRVAFYPVEYDFNEVMNAVIFIGNKLIPDKKDSNGNKIFFTLEGKRKEVYTQLIYYFFNDPKFNGNLSAGLFIHGGKGTGKTMMMNVFRNLSFNGLLKASGKGFNLNYCNAVVSEYESNGAAILQKYHHGNYAFEDLGTENKKANHYGNIRNCMQEILFTRNINFVDCGTLTYITSNFNQEVFADEKDGYGIRVGDRFFEMFNDIKLDGSSLRK